MSQDTGHVRAFGYVATLFFIWGMVTSINDILVPAVKSIFSLSDTAAFFTQFAFFLAYGVVSLPSAALAARVGPSRAIVGGAIVPLIFATVADATSRSTAFAVPMACYTILLAFALAASRKRFHPDHPTMMMAAGH